jgi:hypothetical protein
MTGPCGAPHSRAADEKKASNSSAGFQIFDLIALKAFVMYLSQRDDTIRVNQATRAGLLPGVVFLTATGTFRSVVNPIRLQAIGKKKAHRSGL